MGCFHSLVVDISNRRDIVEHFFILLQISCKGGSHTNGFS
jgi:hypothetical protein